nr:MAG TPA: hypothetical protein [Caudoviricetes sp.]
MVTTVSHETKILNIRGKDCEIDIGCIPMIELLNSIGLDTKYCCQGDIEKNYPYYIMFEDYVTDEQIANLVGKCIGEEGDAFICGKFNKWCRNVGKKGVKLNWIYEIETLGGAYHDYVVFKEVLNHDSRL